MTLNSTTVAKPAQGDLSIEDRQSLALSLAAGIGINIHTGSVPTSNSAHRALYNERGLIVLEEKKKCAREIIELLETVPILKRLAILHY